MAEIKINRAPFLTLWASVVARRLGYDEDEALTLGRAVAGLTTRSKGRRLGVYTARSDEEREKLREKREEIEAEMVTLMDRAIPCVRTPNGLRALSKVAPAAPERSQVHHRTVQGEPCARRGQARRARRDVRSGGA